MLLFIYKVITKLFLFYWFWWIISLDTTKNVIKKYIDFDLANLLYLNQFVIKWCHTHHKYHISNWIILYNWKIIAIVLHYLKLSQWLPRRDDLNGGVFILCADDQIWIFFTPGILLFYRNICNIDGDIAENVTEICDVFDVLKIKKISFIFQ